MNSLEQTKLSFKLPQFTVLDEERYQEYQKEQEQREENERYLYYQKCGVPAKFLEVSLENYQTKTDEEKKNKETVKAFIDNPKNRVLILCGNNGNGKSHLGCAILRQRLGGYITSSDLCIEYEASTSYHAPRTREEMLKYFSKKNMLVIDECGKYMLNENLEKFLLVYLISARYENNLPTVLITNANKKEFIEFLGKSVYDRLTEVCTTLEFTGESKRKGLRENKTADK